MKDECSEETLDSMRIEKTNFDEQFEFKPVNKKKHDKKKQDGLVRFSDQTKNE